MTTSAYPELTPVDGMSNALPLRKRVSLVWEELHPYHTTYASWLIGILSSIVAQMMPTESKTPFLVITGATYLLSIVMFYLAVRKGFRRRANKNREVRTTLMQMGVVHPGQFLLTYPKHLEAYTEFKRVLNKVPAVEYLDMMFNRHHAIAMLIFLNVDPDKHTSTILSIVEHRGVTQPIEIVSMLGEMGDYHSALAEGSL